LLGVVWAAGVYWLSPSYLWWLLPIVGALVLSIPLSVFMSRVSLGRRTKRRRLFAIPEESQPPVEIRRMQELLNSTPPLPDFAAAVADPTANALACAVAPQRATPAGEVRRSSMEEAERALSAGAGSLTPRQKLALLNEPAMLSALHVQVAAAQDTRQLQ